jgi:hypothetical protein
MKLGRNGGSVGGLTVSVPSKLPLNGTSVAAAKPAAWSPVICAPVASAPADLTAVEKDVGPVGETDWLQATNSGTNRTAARAKRMRIVILSFADTEISGNPRQKTARL